MLAAIAGILTEDEAELCRRAANSKHLQHPKHATDADYRQATAFEALLGMLSYLGREDRLQQILDLSYEHLKGE
jgi:ribonuclease-3 family protein